MTLKFILGHKKIMKIVSMQKVKRHHPDNSQQTKIFVGAVFDSINQYQSVSINPL